MKYLIIICMSLMLLSCGFKPIYKITEINQNPISFQLEFLNAGQVSRHVKNEIEQFLVSEGEQNYKLTMAVEEDRAPLIINTNGTVDKYRITIILNFLVTDNVSDELIIEDSVRGHAQYDVGTSEIDNEDKRLQMTRSATSDASQIMMSKILSGINSLNDN